MSHDSGYCGFGNSVHFSNIDMSVFPLELSNFQNLLSIKLFIQCIVLNTIRHIFDVRCPAKMLGIYTPQMTFSARMRHFMFWCRRLPKKGVCDKNVYIPYLSRIPELPVSSFAFCERPRQTHILRKVQNLCFEKFGRFFGSFYRAIQRPFSVTIPFIMKRAEALGVIGQVAVFYRTSRLGTHWGLHERSDCKKGHRSADTFDGPSSLYAFKWFL